MSDEETIQMPPAPGSFGALSRDQMILMAQHPPRPDAERAAKGLGVDPLAGVITASQHSSQTATLHSSIQAMVGRKCYHVKKKQEVTVQSVHAGGAKAVVKRDNGSTFEANVSNLRLL